VIDHDELAEYEDWKARKLAGQLDLSVEAYNREQESQALAWEAGARALAAEFNTAPQDLTFFMSRNPHRQPGMRGHRGTSRVASDPRTLIPTEYDPEAEE
jgi:hypothetical protein